MKQLLVVAILLTIVGCRSEMDRTIKEGYFDACQTDNVETLVESFFANPKWESFVSPDDNKYHLNASGQILYDNETVNALIQFEMEGDGRWQINAFELNGEPQDEYMVTELINEMCFSTTD